MSDKNFYILIVNYFQAIIFLSIGIAAILNDYLSIFLFFGLCLIITFFVIQFFMD